MPAKWEKGRREKHRMEGAAPRLRSNEEVWQVWGHGGEEQQHNYIFNPNL